MEGRVRVSKGKVRGVSTSGAHLVPYMPHDPFGLLHGGLICISNSISNREAISCLYNPHLSPVYAVRYGNYCLLCLQVQKLLVIQLILTYSYIITSTTNLQAMGEYNYYTV